jgi:FMN phosphatase YigB (HAD superfamily)
MSLISSRFQSAAAADGPPDAGSKHGAADARQPGIRNPVTGMGRIRAVLFDLDGTLYQQRPLRALMALELAALALRRPIEAPRRWRVLAAFRQAQEALRAGQAEDQSAGQFELAARRCRMPVVEVEAVIAEWMIERPLKYLPRCRAEGLLPLLDFLSLRRVKVGVLSDYPAGRKLEALGIAGRFSVVLSAADAGIGRFKPHPRGFLAASARWGLDAAEVLVVGDRRDADAAGAAAAGMPCVLIEARRSPDFESSGCLSLSSLERLRDVLDDHDHDSSR